MSSESSNGLGRRVVRALRMSPKSWVLLFEAFWTVVWVRVLLTLRQTDRLRAVKVARDSDKSLELKALREVSWSVAATSRLVPHATCLTQAFAGQLMLARRGFASRVSISVACDQLQSFLPHAWLIVGSRILLGGTVADYQRHNFLTDFENTAEADRS